MRRPHLAACLLCLPLAFAGTLYAEEDAKFQFGLESRFSEPMGASRADFTWGVIPNFSYFVHERVRVDAFAGIGWSEQDELFLSLQPGVRYYLGPLRGKFRYNTGLSIGFTVLDQSDDRYEAERLAALGLDAPPPERDSGVWLRAVPIEVEYWGSKRWGLTAALDYQSRFGDSGLADDSGFGVAAGFRFKIR